MLIGVVSDTHGHVDYTRPAVRMLESLEVERVLHCGDIGSVEIPPLFEQWSADFVFGNVDRHREELANSIERIEGHRCHGQHADLEIDGRRIIVIHGDDTSALKRSILVDRPDLVCTGHTHKSELRRENGTLVLNPGALYRANPHTFAVLDTTTLDANIVSVGERTR